MSRLSRSLAYGYTFLVLFFLYAPLFIMVLMGFNRSELYELPFHFDLVWYRAMFQNERLIRAATTSIGLGVAVAVVATILGTMAAWALVRYHFRGRQVLQTLLIPPITIPWLILAVAMLLMFYWLGIPRSTATLFLGHVALALPYVVLVMITRLQGADFTLEEAARSLGANPWVAFWRITLPLIRPGIVAAAMFTFTVSFDNFVISHFLAPQGVSTLPVEIYSAIRKGFTPEINAISGLIFIFSAGAILLSSRQIKFV